MVNVTATQRSRILSLLQQDSSPRSGTEIGAALGISRTAVWKHIRTLEEEGYRLEHGKRGYQLLGEPDYVSPSDPAYDPRLVQIGQVVASTMLEARTVAPPRDGVRFFVARRQFAGRGRGQRRWSSPEGGLYCTALFQPHLPSAYCGIYCIQAGLDTAHLLRERFGVACRFVWPNDLYIGTAKLGGLLLEIGGETELPSRGALGLGINVGETPDGPDYDAIALRQAPGSASAGSRELLPRTLFAALKPVIEAGLLEDEPDPAAVARRWTKENAEVGRRRIVAGREVTIEGMNPNGSLAVRDSDGRPAELASGGQLFTAPVGGSMENYEGVDHESAQL